MDIELKSRDDQCMMRPKIKLIISDKIKIKGTNSYCDRVYWFLDSLYRIQFYLEHPSFFINLSSTQIATRIGRHYRRIIDDLVTTGLIEVNERYVQGKFSKSYRLTRPYREANFRVETVKTPLIARKIAQQRRRQRNLAYSHRHGRINWENIQKLVFDVESAKRHAVSREARYFLTQYESDRHQFYSIDEQGRHYHYVAAMPRHLRRFLSLPGEDLVILDFRHCQPSLHVTLYPEDCAERRKFIELCQRGHLWGYLNALLKDPYDLSDPDEKSAFKERCFGEIFYRPVNRPPRYLPLAFASEFPLLWERICQEKTPDHAALPLRMQRLEALIVIGGVLSNQYFCVSIHDAIMTTRREAAEVRKRMEAAFVERVRFIPVIEQTEVVAPTSGFGTVPHPPPTVTGAASRS